jgi:hypothetical protein
MIFRLFTALSLAVVSYAQTSNGVLTGYITDPSDSPVAQAVIEMQEVRTGLRWSATTNTIGAFTQPYLPPGSYTVRISAKGFATTERRDVLLNANSTVRLDARLNLSSAQEKIEVVSELAPLQTDRSDLSRSLNTKQLLELPLATRNFQELASILPGVTPTSDVSTTLQNPMDTRAYQANGQLRSSNNSMLDGTDNNDPLIGVTINVPPVEAIAEVNMALGNFSAELGVAVAR